MGTLRIGVSSAFVALGRNASGSNREMGKQLENCADGARKA